MDDLVITGVGALTALGFGGEPLAAALRGGASAVRRSASIPGLFAAEISAAPKSFVPRKGLASLSRAAQIGAAAIESLLRAAPPPPEETAGYGLVTGTAFGHIDSKARFHDEAQREGVGLVSPMVFPNTIINSLAGHAAILYGFRGPNSTVTSGRRSGLDALLRAGSLLRSGRARRMVVAGCDEASPALARALRAAGELSPEDPFGPSPSTPFAVGRSGIYLGEGAAAVFLESSSAAAEAGRQSFIKVLGWGEASTVSRTLEAAVAEALRAALERGDAKPADVSWLSLSGCGSPELDAAEAAAVREVFGEGKPSAALKAIFGETFGAAGMIACAAAALARREDIVPATPGSERSQLEGLAPAPRRAASGPILLSAVETSGATAVLVA
jgi:3-oxoacyl-[acyl-carrier-protein] synthase II